MEPPKESRKKNCMEPLKHMHQDLIEPILHRLPVKTLIRFKFTSKLWNTYISDPKFIHTYSHRGPKTSFPSHVIRPPIFGFEVERGLKYGDIEPLMECCNGLVLVIIRGDKNIASNVVMWKSGPIRGERDEIFVWNPAMRMVKHLQPHPPEDLSHPSYGFGYNAEEDDFKVVIFDKMDLMVEKEKATAQIYSCKESSWTTVTIGYDVKIYDVDTASMICNGNPYWLGDKVLLAFDSIKMTFYTVSLPVFEEVGAEDDYGIECWEGHVCVLHYVSNTDDWLDHVDVWKYNHEDDGKWEKTCTFDFGGIHDKFNIDYCWGCNNAGNFGFLCKDGRMIIYDPNINDIVVVTENLNKFKDACFFAYGESLAEVPGMVPAVITGSNTDLAEVRDILLNGFFAYVKDEDEGGMVGCYALA